MSFKRPPLATFIEFVQRYDKRVGLRKLYKDYEIPDEMRPRFRQMWDKIAQEVERAGKTTKKPKKKKAKKKKKKQ